MKIKKRTLGLLTLTPLVLTFVTGCSPTVALDPAADAVNPGCASIIVHLPSTLDDLAIRQTDAQATGAWGDPTAVILRCGITPPGPTTDTCYTVRGIDWLRDSSKAPTYVFTTYGRVPATQVIVDAKQTNGQGTIVLDELSNAIGQVKQSRKCLSREDVLSTGGSTTEIPAPTPSK
jgi:hypothetical protein